MSIALQTETQHQFVSSSHAQKENNTVETLIDEFEKMFTMDNLEKNTYLIFKMNASLEIPLYAIYKERKIMSITTNYSQILEALSKVKSVTIDKERELLRINIMPIRNKIVINKINQDDKDHLLKCISTRSEYINKINDKYYDSFRSYTITFANESDTLSMLEYVKSLEFKAQPDIILEQENPYLSLLQKAQDEVKLQGQDIQHNINQQPDNFNYFNPYYYGNPYFMMSQQYGFKGQPMNYPNYYYNNRNYHNSMFIRKAEDQEFETREKNDGSRYKNYQQKPYYGNKNYKGKGGYYAPYNRDSNDYRKPQSNPNQEEKEKRTRLNSDNFPPLSAVPLEEKKPEIPKKVENQVIQKEEKPVEEPTITITEVPASKEEKPIVQKENKPIVQQIEEKPVITKKEEKLTTQKEKILHIKKDEFISCFSKMKEIKINANLEKLNVSQVPVLEKNAKPTLELINPSPRKTPELTKANRKHSNMGIISI